VIVTDMPAVTAMPEDVQQRAECKQQERQRAQQMRAVLGQQEETGDSEETDQHPVDPQIPPVGVMLMFFMRHGTHLSYSWFVSRMNCTANTYRPK
jgi:uncharacterized damage-inducible protein DinB